MWKQRVQRRDNSTFSTTGHHYFHCYYYDHCHDHDDRILVQLGKRKSWPYFVPVGRTNDADRLIWATSWTSQIHTTWVKRSFFFRRKDWGNSRNRSSVRIKRIICFGKNMQNLTYFIMWTKFCVFGRNFYILLINYQPRMAEILTVIFMLNCNYLRK